MNRRILLLWVVSISFFTAFGQKEANIWAFGYYAGLNFNSSPPSAITNIAMVSSEGSAVMCSPSGALLFYTNGEKVWNANHLVMPNGNGLRGHNSATQSSVIIPRPGHKSKYFVFALDHLGSSNGLTYSEVDMSLNGGLGDITATKNIKLKSPLTEKLTAIRHKNGTDYWILVHETSSTGNNNRFLAYKVTENGPATTPVTTAIGSEHASSATVGAMKFSPNGKKVACAVRGTDNFAEVFDFDDENGTLSNALRISYTTSPYGIEFSPDSKKLYVTAGNTIYQYTIPEVTNAGVLAASEKQLNSDAQVWALQLAPNQKIYVCKQGSKLGVINNPNNDAVTAGFNDNAVTLSGRAAIQGLPNFSQNLLADNFIEAENLCAGQPTQFSVLLNGLDSVQWDFGDFTAGAHNYSKNLSPQFTYRVASSYTVSVTIYNNGYSETFTRKIDILSLPEFTLGNDTILCKGQVLGFEFTIPGASYLWNSGKRSGKYYISTPGIHTLKVTQNRCSLTDTVKVDYDLVKPDYTINQSVQCFEGNKFEFTTTETGILSNFWFINGTSLGTGKNVSVSLGAAGPYSINHVVVSANNCTDSMTREIKVIEKIKAAFDVAVSNNCGPANRFSFTDKTIFADNYTVEFEIEGRKINKNTVEWNFSTPGKHTAKMTVTTAEGCTDTQEAEITIFAAPDASFTVTTQSACGNGSKFTATKNAALQSYESIVWSCGSLTLSGKEEAVLALSTPGKHILKAEVTNTVGCKSVYEHEVEVFSAPVVDFTTSLNTLRCLGNKAISFLNNSTGDYAVSSYLWDFGDNTTSTQRNPVKDYAVEGNYNVSLTVTNAKGCSTTATKTLSTYEKPDTRIGVDVVNHCENGNAFNVSFVNNNPAAQISSYTWLDDAGRTYNANPLPIGFTTSGEHKLTLIVNTQNGCVDSGFTTLTVHPQPAGALVTDKDAGCLENNSFELTAALANAATISNYTWNFGDGNIQSGTERIIASYAQAGNYNVSLQATNQFGCKTTFTKNITVHPSPVFQIPAVKTCVNNPVTLRVAGLDNNTVITNWAWDLGDGNTSGTTQPTHTYKHSGTFNVSLTVTSDKGCTYTVKNTPSVEIAGLPMADFSWRKTQWGFDETYVDYTAEPLAGDIKTYEWDFGNGFVSNKKAEKVKYDKPGRYVVSLKLTNKSGCVNTFTKEILIVPPFDAYVPTSFTPNGDGKNDIFGMVGVEYINTYKMQVFNRWGQEIFSSTDLAIGWDGRANGIPMPTDMYSYVITITDAEDRPYSLSGTIQLIR